MNMIPPPVLMLMGPTAAGKSDVALALAEQLPVSLISVDSVMVYRGLDIGTAKPDAATRARYPHQLIDILEPTQAYSAAQFRHDALAAIRQAQASGRFPLLVGGTLLYFHALLHGLSPLPAADPLLRQRLEDERQQHGLAALHQRLQAVDPVAAARIHPHDPQRVQRALEVFELTGRPLSQHFSADGSSPVRLGYTVQWIIAPPERADLHQRIEQRFHQMLRQGLIEEVEALRDRGDLDAQQPALRAVGYRQVWQYLHGECDRQTMITASIQATRQLAKRQLTWLRRMTAAQWLDSRQDNLSAALLKQVESLKQVCE